jgi:hypothetical protein
VIARVGLKTVEIAAACVIIAATVTVIDGLAIALWCRR